MEIAYHKEDSRHLGRPMEYKRYGQTGQPVVVFPTSQGRFFQFEDSGAIGALASFIDSGRIQVWTLDGIDGESFFRQGGDPAERVARHEAFFRYVREEAFPAIAAHSRVGRRTLKPLMCGCSMGAFHAANFVFRFPELTSGLIALSGVYSTRDFFGPSLDGEIFYNSPIDYLPGLKDAKILSRIRAQRLIFACGQGRWEERMISDTNELAAILRSKSIPAWVDFWGNDVDHDWPWWNRQLPYFMGHWLDGDLQRMAG